MTSRFDVTTEWGFGAMEKSPDGEYVSYEDYAELKAQRDALAAEVSAIREQAEDVYAAGYRHGHVNTVDGIAYVTPVEDEFYHNALPVMLEVETPATDAYLNSVRAEGIQVAINKLTALDASPFAIHSLECKLHELRAGEPS